MTKRFRVIEGSKDKNKNKNENDLIVDEEMNEFILLLKNFLINNIKHNI